ncbi:MAG: DNA polymerase/3'-5' exonuclease PolX [Solirubrobacteraceae bacterium]
MLAYRSGAKAVRDSTRSVAALARAGRATELAGVGETLSQKILDLVETGTIPAAEKLRARFPPSLIEITRLPGVGAKRARRLYDELGIDSLASLREAAAAERLRAVRGFGAKFEQAVLAAEPPPPRGAERRLRLDQALALGESLVAALRERAPAARIELAGSLRRRAETVKDIDIVLDDPGLLDALGGLELIEAGERTSEGAARGVSFNGVRVELRAAAPAHFGNLLQHLTGSAAHNAALRERAVRRGLHVSEYGIGELRCAEEADVYRELGLPYIEPELRENRGELDATEPPPLVRLADIRGDLHCHTTASDGRASIEQMARAARERGYEYLAITDHSATHGFGNDVSPEELLRQIDRVRAVDVPGLRLLAGSEVNILPDGSPDYEVELLEQLDWVIASVHTSFGMGSDAMTRRLLAACENPLIDAIGHPTGRLIGRREPYAFDTHAVWAAAARTGTLLEINSNPNRRDLSEVNARAAVAAGAQVVINSDAHGPETLDVLRYGIWTARRAWLSAGDVRNTLPWEQLKRR